MVFDIGNHKTKLPAKVAAFDRLHVPRLTRQYSCLLSWDDRVPECVADQPRGQGAAGPLGEEFSLRFVELRGIESYDASGQRVLSFLLLGRAAEAFLR